MKQRRMEKLTKNTEKTACAIILLLVFAFFLFLVPSAFHETSRLGTDDPSGEHIDFYEDNVFLNIIIIILLLSVLYLYYRYNEAKRLRRMEIILLVWIFLFGTAFVVSSKLRSPIYSDSFVVTYGAQRAALGDYALLSDNYFRRFPFQLGYVLYSEVFFRISGLFLHGLPEGYAVIALQEINLLWLLAMMHALIEITGLLFDDPKVSKLLMLLAFFCLPPILTIPFLYGNIPAFSCGTLAVWMFLLFMKQGKLRWGLLCALSLSASVTLKLNLLIVSVAIASVWLIELLRRFSLRSLLCLALTVFCVLTIPSLPKKLYEKRVGVTYGQGIPMIAWMAMGLSEGYAAPGWYLEEHTVTAFEKSKYDPAATAEKARQVIAERLHVFRNDRTYAVHFFSEKLRSQWNEPSYGSLWLNQVFPSYSEKGALSRYLCEGGQRQTLSIMNHFQQLVFFAVLLGLVSMWRERDIFKCLLPLILLGGLLYHLMFEAKSQYALPYFMLMLPVAAFGLHSLFRKVEMQ